MCLCAGEGRTWTTALFLNRQAAREVPQHWRMPWLTGWLFTARYALIVWSLTAAGRRPEGEDYSLLHLEGALNSTYQTLTKQDENKQITCQATIQPLHRIYFRLSFIFQDQLRIKYESFGMNMVLWFCFIWGDFLHDLQVLDHLFVTEGLKRL